MPEKEMADVTVTLECGHMQDDQFSLRSAALWCDDPFEVMCRTCDTLKFVDRRILKL